MELAFLSDQQSYLFLQRIYKGQSNRSCSWDDTYSHTARNHLTYDEWQYCCFKLSRTVQREPARSWKGARIANASLFTGTNLPSRFLIQDHYSRCQHGAGEVNKIKNASSEEEKVSKQQKTMGAIAYLSLL